MRINRKRLLKTIERYGLSRLWDSRDFILALRKQTPEYARKTEERLKDGRYLNDLKLLFYYNTGYELNLEHPETFSEKIVWSSVYGSTPLKTRLADKYLAKDWINERLGREYAVPLLGVWDAYDDIDFHSLPEAFALKTNHGCRWQRIVRDKSCFDTEQAKKDFDRWMSMKYTFCSAYEMQYLEIPPKIIAEECLPPFLRGSNEYKFLCFDGRVDSIYVFHKPVINGKEVYTTTMYSPEWERLDWRDDIEWPEDPGIMERPAALDEMLSVASRLSEGFNFVRVDLYEVSGRIYVGELTFTPGGGRFRFSSREEELRLGRQMVL